MAAVIARSLAEAFSLKNDATSLLLRDSPDLRCINIMCEQVGRGCACRLALSMGRMTQLQVIDISRNSLPKLPDSLWGLERLRVLSLADNALTVLPIEVQLLKNLEVIDLSGNKLETLPWGSFFALDKLKRIVISRNPLRSDELERAKHILPSTVSIIQDDSMVGEQEGLENLLVQEVQPLR